MHVDPLTSHNWVEDDHIRLSFFQIRVENLNRGPPDFQFFAYFMMFLTSSDLRTNHSAVLWVRRGPPSCAWFVLICGLDTKSYTTENQVDPSRFSTLIWKNNSLIWSTSALLVWRQKDSTCIPSLCCLWYVFWVKYLTTNDIQQLILLESEHLIFFHLMLVLFRQILII